MPESGCAAVILAAGKSTRMKSRVPKPLHPVCGLPLTAHVSEACKAAGVTRTVVVVGFEADAVKEGLGTGYEFALQADQRGSGDAAKAAEEALRGFDGPVLVLAGDVPLLRAETVRTLLRHHRETGAAATLLTSFLDDPTGYGRIVRAENGTVARIVEHKDATPHERSIREWNPSIYCFDGRTLFPALHDIRPDNVQGEYYLTDVIGLLAAQGLRVEAVPVHDAEEVLGVNTRVELAEVGRILRQRILHELMISGVTITDPQSTYIDVGVKVGQDSVVEPQTFLYRGTEIGTGCTIGPFSRIAQSSIGDDTTILASQVVSCRIGSHVKIGPYANLRPGCTLADGVKIGDFVELKNATLGEKVSASHLSYIGDAEVGARVNLGAGVITCNYDGYRKSRTVIGDGAFIGTNSALVAPVTIGEGAVVAAGSTVTHDVPADALALARARQENKADYARRRRERLTRKSE
jgi:bifunctional UDP-N-acetylglucosamine pyrophosphorylase / glucosamine-1-phosphate N-acetyltransferase